MAGELVYTSVAKGLNKGESGFCVVARSAAISPLLLNRLKAMSGYREIFSAIDPKVADNPVNFASTLIGCGSERFKVISRVGFAGLDYSGRSNKIADHLILTATESANAGPAELLSTQGLFYTKWDTPPAILDENAKLIPTKTAIAGLAEYWHKITGNTGWAEHLIELSRRNAEQPLYIITKTGIDNLTLVREALRLLPINEQWEYTFSTYCSSNIHGINYRWRFIYPGTDIYDKVINNPHILKFDLNNLPEQMYQTASTANNKTIMGKPLQLRAQQANITPDLFKVEIAENISTVNGNRANRSQRHILITCALVIAITIIFLYLFTSKSDKVAPVVKSNNELSQIQPTGTTPSANPENTPPVASEDKIQLESNNRPLLIVLDKDVHRAVTLKRSLMTVLEEALNSPAVATVELQLQMNQKQAQLLARECNIEFNNHLIAANHSIPLNIDIVIEAVLSEMVNGIAVKEFMTPLHNGNPRLLEQIALHLTKSTNSDNKDFYENSAEYLLGELYMKFKQHYMAFDIQRAEIIRKQRKLNSEMVKLSKQIDRYNNELTDSGMELGRSAKLKAKQAVAQKTTAQLLQQKKQLAGDLKSFKQPEVLIACRVALLQAFFCFGKNYMAEAEKIINLDNTGIETKVLKPLIKNCSIAQQFSYEHGFKTELNGYIYRLVVKKIVIEMQTKLEKLRMRLEYNRQHKTFNLIIEDSNHERP